MCWNSRGGLFEWTFHGTIGQNYDQVLYFTNMIFFVKLSQIDLFFIYIIFSTMTEHFEKQTERIKKRNDEDYDEV